MGCVRHFDLSEYQSGMRSSGCLALTPLMAVLACCIGDLKASFAVR